MGYLHGPKVVDRTQAISSRLEDCLAATSMIDPISVSCESSHVRFYETVKCRVIVHRKLDSVALSRHVLSRAREGQETIDRHHDVVGRVGG